MAPELTTGKSLVAAGGSSGAEKLGAAVLGDDADEDEEEDAPVRLARADVALDEWPGIDTPTTAATAATAATEPAVTHPVTDRMRRKPSSRPAGVGMTIIIHGRPGSCLKTT